MTGPSTSAPARRRPSSDHVVMDLVSQEFRCDHCGITYKPTLPSSIGLFVAISKQFTAEHLHCHPPKEPRHG